MKPWREVITPHPGVASGNFVQAEFAADLWQLYLGEGSSECKDPREFYRRTCITEGLRNLLIEALKRLSSRGRNPLIELQTNFGGGKTHSLLALYHLFSGGADVVEEPSCRLVILPPGRTHLAKAADKARPAGLRQAVRYFLAL